MLVERFNAVVINPHIIIGFKKWKVILVPSHMQTNKKISKPHTLVISMLNSVVWKEKIK